MQKYTSWIITGGLVLLILGSMIWYSSKPGKYDDFAACIKESGATFFGAFWCPHCQEQKALFGKSAKGLPYVECSTIDGQNQTQECKVKGIESYPTWHFAPTPTTGTTTIKTGVLSFTELASFTGCAFIEK